MGTDGMGMGTVGAGTGTRFVMRGGDGDQIPSPCHSLLERQSVSTTRVSTSSHL